MVRIRVAVVIRASPDNVWVELSDIASHADWMQDAELISFVGTQRSGVGTAFDCVTKVGPIRLTDRMEVTEWVEEMVMGVRHTGLVSGAGQFRLSPVAVLARLPVGQAATDSPSQAAKSGDTQTEDVSGERLAGEALSDSGVVSGVEGVSGVPPGCQIHTELTWTETLQFPWRLGGRIGAALARPILRRIWARNLSNLATRL